LFYNIRMFEFLSAPLFHALPYGSDAERRRRARLRGLIFSADELADLLALWRDVIAGEPVHSIDRLTLPTRDGGTVDLAPHSIRINPPESRPASPEALHAAMQHIAQHWSGEASIPYDAAASRTDRLLMRAYAEVYGVQLDDSNDCFAHLAFTRDELARLPALRAEIRATNSDVPPARTDEEAELAAMYRRRYPFRVPAAA
jgi:hypothetical protein